MFDSIVKDIKYYFRSGNMVTRLIIFNIGIFMVTALIEAFAPSFYMTYIRSWLAIPSPILEFLYKPWTIVTHMFLHYDIWHVGWNMLGLYWFGRIVGDLIGDRHILPIYLLGGLAGGVSILIAYLIVPQYIGLYGLGASAAVLAIVLVAGMINPDHEIRLMFIGAVKIKFIVMAFIFFDLLGIGKTVNTGGHIAHLVGMAMGWFYIHQLGGGNDLAKKINGKLDYMRDIFRGGQMAKPKSPLTVKHRSSDIKKNNQSANSQTDMQSQVDTILDKIKQKGYGSLTDIEKEILYQASKK